MAGDQQGVDIVVALHGLNGEKIVEVDNPGRQYGPDLVVLLAEVPGSYRLEVR